MLEPGVNDGEEVFKLLLTAGRVQSVLEGIAGPYAFVYFDAVGGRVWFGRDAVGRRSLLCRYGERWEDGVVVASVGDGDKGVAWKEVEADGVRFLDLEKGGDVGWVPFMWEGEGEEFMVGYSEMWFGMG